MFDRHSDVPIVLCTAQNGQFNGLVQERGTELMNQDLQLQLQPYLGGELPEREARRVADWLERNQEAQGLLAELSLTKDILQQNEWVRPLPETREFYWSKIDRAIQHSDRSAPTRTASDLTLWRRMLAPLAGVALLTFLTLTAVQYFNSRDGNPYAGELTEVSHLAEVETPFEEVGAYSFRSRSGNMFVVWLYNRTPEQPAE